MDENEAVSKTTCSEDTEEATDAEEEPEEELIQ
jgi:hypothetical protein